MADLRGIIQNSFSSKKVVIVGDIVADQFLNGTISRVSREAPVFILRHDQTETLPGSAANAAANVASLGATAVLVGLIGEDANGSLLRNALNDSVVDTTHVIADASLITTTKVRVLAARDFAVRQQVIRIDYEHAPITEEIASLLREHLASACEDADAIIVSDYDYGVVSDDLYADARGIAASRGIPIVVDSRSRLAELTRATSATPNREEVEGLLGKGFTDADCDALRERLGLNALLVTHGNEGSALFEGGRGPEHLDAVGGSEPVDVTGAGDTVIAAFTLGLVSGMSFSEAARIANHAGGLVVMKKGTASVSAEELLGSIASQSPPLASSKHTN
jgi:rfaE bifunctional protein kinase chain/domain